MSRRTLLMLLGLSVAINLFCLGVVAARAWQRAEWRSHRDAARPAFGEARRGPGPPRPEPFRWLSEAERAELRPPRKALRATRRQAEEVLRAEQFDVEKFRAALAALRAETDGIQASVHELLIRRASSLNVEERRRLADANWGHDDHR
jgi:uncharacterized membrane protein